MAAFIALFNEMERKNTKGFFYNVINPLVAYRNKWFRLDRILFKWEWIGIKYELKAGRMIK